MDIFLNGNRYVLEAGTGVRRVPLVEFPANTRLDGQQKRKDRSDISSWAIDRWSNGLGFQRMNVDVATQLYRLWDVENCDTRHPSHIVLSPQMQVPTIVPSRGDLNVAFDYIGQLYFCTTRGTAAQDKFGDAFQFAAPDTLGSYRVIGTGNNFNQIRAIHSIGATIIVAGRDGSAEGIYQGEDFAAVDNIIGAAGGIEGDFGVFPQLTDIGGTLHVLSYKANRVHFYIGDTLFGTLHAVATSPEVVGTFLAPLVSDGVNVYANTPKGIWNFDAVPNLVVDTTRAQDKNNMQTMFNNNLHFKNKKSLVEYDGSDTEGVGYDLNDGLPKEQFGEITAMTSSAKYLFAAIKGGTYSHILTRDEGGAWQYYARIPTAGIWVREMFLSDAPDAIDRLWCIFGSASHPGFFLNPMVNPLSAGTYKFVPTGHFTKPIFDGGMAEEPGAWYDTVVTADGIGGNNTITALYGLDGALPVTTLGVVATNPETLVFGSPYGVGGHRIQPDFLLSGANSGTTPIYRDATIHYLKLPNEREAFDFAIDLEETARARVNPLEAVIGSLNSERSSKILMPFWYGQIGTKAVKVMQMPFQEEVEEDKIFQGERSGITSIRVAEIT